MTMPSADIHSAYEAAYTRWPRIAWSEEDFTQHIREIEGMGRTPRYLEDLYVAGAAGYRREPAWEIIQSEVAPAAQRVLARKPKANFTVEELWSETVLRLLDNDTKRSPLADGQYPAKLVRYQGLVKLLNYFITVAIRIAIQGHRSAKPEPVAPEGLEGVAEAEPSSSGLQDRETLERIVVVLQKACSGLSAEQRFLIRMVHGQGMKQNEAARLLGITKFTANRRLKDAIRALRESLTRADLDRPVVSDHVWESVWNTLWKLIQDDASPNLA